MNEPEHRLCDPWEPFPYCDCGRTMRHGYCPDCDKPTPGQGRPTNTVTKRERDMSYVEYDTNNSGGDWWLTDADWKALEDAGWEVEWFSQSDTNLMVRDGRFLGALANRAIRRGLSLADAVSEFESVTSACSTDVGCPCCGPPHRFTEYDDDDNFVRSGPDVEYTATW